MFDQRLDGIAGDPEMLEQVRALARSAELVDAKDAAARADVTSICCKSGQLAPKRAARYCRWKPPRNGYMFLANCVTAMPVTPVMRPMAKNTDSVSATFHS